MTTLRAAYQIGAETRNEDCIKKAAGPRHGPLTRSKYRHILAALLDGLRPLTAM
jgi:hypothetical protein